MDIINLPVIKEFCRATTEIYAHGWAERNGGNISMLLEEDLSSLSPIRKFPADFEAEELIGKCLVITGSGKYLKNVSLDPETNIGIIRICRDGAELLWGLKDGANPSSELFAHILSHRVRLKADPNHRVVIHTHATNLVAMTFVHQLTDRDFTRALWSMGTECMMFFPDGVSVLPWMPCGTEDIGSATADKMKLSRIVVWAHHGVFSAGSSPDDALGLIEVAEKAAELFMKTAHLPILSRIDDERLWALCHAMDIKPREGFLVSPNKLSEKKSGI